MSPLIFKVATEPDEFEQIHHLNYQTFVQEIPQHHANPEGRLVDKFHTENTYIICLEGNLLVGMVCARDNRPFSLDLKLENLDSYLPPHQSICELRLLAIAKSHRNPKVFRGLMAKLAEYGESKGYDLGIMSGSTRQLKLYRHLGFEPFGPLVGAEEARFQPMYLTFAAYEHLKSESRMLEALLKKLPKNRFILYNRESSQSKL